MIQRVALGSKRFLLLPRAMRWCWCGWRSNDRILDWETRNRKPHEKKKKWGSWKSLWVVEYLVLQIVREIFLVE